MKGLVPLFLGLFGTFAFSWIGLTVIPNSQIGHLDPQSDEEGTDVYPMPQSGMAERGRRVYVGNGCMYCHSQQVRPDYAAADVDRKWGERRSAPRDYVFDRPVLLGKMRLGPDLSNIGKRAPADDANAPVAEASPAAPNQSPAPGASPVVAAASPAAGASPARSTSTPAVAAAATSPAPAENKEAAAAPAAPAAPAQSAPPGPSPATPQDSETKAGDPPQYSAAWHHRHLYSPRAIAEDSNMPAYRFLYDKRRISGERPADALKLTGRDAPPEGYEIVPSYEAKCLVAYLMSRDQSHPLKEVKSATPPSPPASGKEATKK
ncbi:MAG: cbb3-type cytochrome c oxidase subunit II [Spartobacteria bacterium]